MGLRRVVSVAGLHARPAAVFVKAVLDSGIAVRINEADARSIIAVLALDIRPGGEVLLAAEDEGVLDQLAHLLTQGNPVAEAGIEGR